MLKYHFRNSTRIYDPKIKTFTDKSTWTPPIKLMSENTINTICNIEKSTRDIINNFDQYLYNDKGFIKLSEKPNLTLDEQNSLRMLKDNNSIIIKPADKGGATVILDKDNYILEAIRQLNDTKYYKKIDKPLYMENADKIRSILMDLKSLMFINDKKFDYLYKNKNIKPRSFYILPKIHKPINTWTIPGKLPQGRPIVSNINSETYNISQYIESYLAPLANKHDSYIKNSYEFVNKIRNFTVPVNALIVTGDIGSLYTNMHHDRTINCVKKFLGIIQMRIDLTYNY